MNVPIILLIVFGGILVIILAILALPVLGYTSAAKGPDDKTIVRIIEGVLGLEIGNKYEVFDKDWHFAHSDGILSCRVKIPESKFAIIFDECKNRLLVTDDSQISTSKHIENAGSILACHTVTLDEKSGIIIFHSFGC